MNWRRLATVVLLIHGALIVIPIQADADTYIDCYQGAGVCGPDDKVHYWCFGSSYDGYPTMMDAASWAMNKHENDTVLTTTQVSSCTQYTDVRFVRANIGSTTAGRYDCVAWAGADHPHRCAAATVTINRDAIAAAATDADIPWSDGVNETGQLERMYKKTSCHEAGHSVGYFHHPGSTEGSRTDFYDGSSGAREQDCMVSGWIELDQSWLRINAHHADHLSNFLN